MKTSIKKVKASGGMYVLTTWEETKQGVQQKQEWYNTKDEAQEAEVKVKENYEQTT